MNNEELRKSITKGLKIVDRRTLKMINAILWESLAPDDTEDENDLYEELAKRSKAHKSGKSLPLTVEEARARYGKRSKKR